ncbi:C15orf24 protein [Angomonas deanei]|uniref:ER membrane protein complex subunit 7 beta-sandwich domain-containing protein n=1 Tax=Angomonas deanei TaxID=59799 RepID=A0A7G2C8V0_9TRYP|nr:C15orf24 protein [Angomonas deanei]CAD2215865.1 Protein of unknown function (DUF2012), putative [Angomonas deanei]|eukprot:EPY37771.1 C15orf24 protein [Angomonas deanei]
MSRATVLFLLVTLLCLSVSSAESEHLQDSTSLYGLIKVPPAFLSAPEADAPSRLLQHGSVLLFNSEHTIRVPILRDGSFVAYRVPYGVYILQPEYYDFVFPTIRVVIQYKETQQGRVPVIRGDLNDAPVKPLVGSGLDEESPLLIPIRSVHMYYIPRQQYSLGSILKNPPILIMLVTISMFGLLKLFPEESVKESRKMSREWQRKALSGLVSPETQQKIQERQEKISSFM